MPTRMGLLWTASLVLFLPSGSEAQAQRPELFVAAGATRYQPEGQTPGSDRLPSVLRLGIKSGFWGASATYNNSDVPWLKPPGSVCDGPNPPPECKAECEAQALRLIGELYPLLLVPSAAKFVRYVNPFIGGGVQWGFEGGEEETGDEGSFELDGGASMALAYGLRATLPTPIRRVSLALDYRENVLFARGNQYRAPGSAAPQQLDSDVLRWGEWSIGFTIGLGGQ